MALTEKKRLYAEARLSGKNKREAARLAGVQGNDKSTSVTAHRLENDPDVQAYVAAEQSRLRKKSGITRERWLRELQNIAFSNIEAYAKWGEGAMVLTPSKELPKSALKAVLQVEEKPSDNGPKMKLKLHNKEKALEIMGRALGFFDKEDGPKTDLTEININIHDYTDGSDEK
jgi:phage terminase small subunit